MFTVTIYFLSFQNCHPGGKVITWVLFCLLSFLSLCPSMKAAWAVNVVSAACMWLRLLCRGSVRKMQLQGTNNLQIDTDWLLQIPQSLRIIYTLSFNWGLVLQITHVTNGYKDSVFLQVLKYMYSTQAVVFLCMYCMSWDFYVQTDRQTDQEWVSEWCVCACWHYQRKRVGEWGSFFSLGKPLFFSIYMLSMSVYMCMSVCMWFFVYCWLNHVIDFIYHMPHPSFSLVYNYFLPIYIDPFIFWNIEHSSSCDMKMLQNIIEEDLEFEACSCCLY